MTKPKFKIAFVLVFMFILGSVLCADPPSLKMPPKLKQAPALQEVVCDPITGL